MYTLLTPDGYFGALTLGYVNSADSTQGWNAGDFLYFAKALHLCSVSSGCDGCRQKLALRAAFRIVWIFVLYEYSGL